MSKYNSRREYSVALDFILLSGIVGVSSILYGLDSKIYVPHNEDNFIKTKNYVIREESSSDRLDRILSDEPFGYL